MTLPAGDLLEDSNFSAATIGASTLLNVQPANDAVDFGLFALTNTKKTQLNSVKIGQYGSRAYTTWSSRRDAANDRPLGGQFVLNSLL